MPIKLINLIPQSDGTGWGVCGTNIKKHISEFCHEVGKLEECDAILAPVANFKWGYAPEHVLILDEAIRHRKPVVGYAFHEFDILGTSQIHYLPVNWTALACGSTWMSEWVSLALHEVAPDFPVRTVLQGVDTSLFNYRKVDRPDFMQGRFVIGSAGKFEYRKGQDVVIEAFRRFKRQVPEAFLVTNWSNPWPQSMATMKNSEYKWGLQMVRDENGMEFIGGVDPELISRDDQSSWKPGPNSEMPDFYALLDCALFPNRLEAGQALPACEAVACGVPSILADAHGMSDLFEPLSVTCCEFMGGGKWAKFPKEESVAHFWEPCVNECVSLLHKLHRNTSTEDQRVSLSHSLDNWRWRDTAKGLVDLCELVVK